MLLSTNADGRKLYLEIQVSWEDLREWGGPVITWLGCVEGRETFRASPAFHHSASARREGETSLPPSAHLPAPSSSLVGP